MQCENIFCIYHKGGICTLSRIELNASGICTSCILINIPEQTLNDLKEKTLQEM